MEGKTSTSQMTQGSFPSLNHGRNFNFQTSIESLVLSDIHRSNLQDRIFKNALCNKHGKIYAATIRIKVKTLSSN